MHAVLQLHRSLDGHGLFLHQDIREGRKQAGGAGGHLKLGTPLTIIMAGTTEPLTFEDLDDVIANFAEPYLENVRALVGSALRSCRSASSWCKVKYCHTSYMPVCSMASVGIQLGCSALRYKTQHLRQLSSKLPLPLGP